MLFAVKRSNPDANLNQTLMDFESVVINKFRDSFPNSERNGSLSSPRVYRKAHELGMKAEMESSKELSTSKSFLPALAIALNDSMAVIWYFADSVPEHDYNYGRTFTVLYTYMQW